LHIASPSPRLFLSKFPRLPILPFPSYSLAFLPFLSSYAPLTFLPFLLLHTSQSPSPPLLAQLGSIGEVHPLACDSNQGLQTASIRAPRGNMAHLCSSTILKQTLREALLDLCWLHMHLEKVGEGIQTENVSICCTIFAYQFCLE
jgi:hypothetical protein